MEESVNVLRFSEARASEIASLMEDVSYRKNKTAAQKLPPHLRRRAASHNPKRVPRKLRESYLIQNPHATSKPKKAPKKMRKKQQKKKHEKQSKNYPEEYASRSRPDGVWLETHIWHAKRCRMENFWGYKLPIHCNDKKLGATHQAATKHAMLQDLSYYCCIALKGPEDHLFDCLSCLTDPNTGSHFASEMYRDGAREGHTFLYHPNKFPYEAIGPVTFIWKPIPTTSTHSETQNSPDVIRRLWIWCHPSFHEELVAVLMTVFQLREVPKENVSNSSSEITKTGDGKGQNETVDNKKEVIFASKVNYEKTKQHFLRENQYANECVQMSLLKDKLVRHCLIGPNAQFVMSNVLSLADVGEVLQLTDKEPSSTIMFNGDSRGSQLNPEVSVDEESDRSSKKIRLDLKVAAEEDYYNMHKQVKLDSDQLAVKDSSVSKSETTDGVKILKLAVNGRTESELKVTEKENHCHQETIEKSPLKKIKLCKLDEQSKAGQLDTTKCDLWWQSYYRNDSSKVSQTKRKKLLEYLRNGRSGYYIPPSTVIGFTVRDPRLILSRDKQKFVSSEGSDIGSIEELLTPDIADSPLWDDDIRDEVTATQISESEINKERSKYAIPSEACNMGDKESRVPILLIHHAGTNGFGSGWDLIAPLGWSMPFWIPFVLNGGRATGLKDLHFVNLETGQASFPLSYPDTRAGACYEETQRVEELTTYYKRPKAKRPNFTTFGIPNPFFMPWDVLVDDWEKEFRSQGNDILFSTVLSSTSQNITFEGSDVKKEFFVLRQKEIRQLQSLCEKLSKLPRAGKPGAARELENLKRAYNNFVISNLTSQKQFFKSLILVRLKCLTRGCPTKHSGVFALNDCDLKEVKNNPNFLGPVEPNHTNRDIAGDSKDKCSSVAEKNESSIEKVKPSPEEELKKESKSSDLSQIDPKDLERPQVHTFKSVSSHKMIGYLSEGGFSSIMGKGCGIGHCSFLGFLFTLRSCINAQLRHPLVLLREQHSFQYRVSSVEIIPNYL